MSDVEHPNSTSVQMFVRSIKTEARTPTDEIVANLHSFKTRATVEHWEPAHVYGRLSHEEIVASGGITNSADVVFGVSDGDNVYVIGYRLGSQRGTKNVSVFRDGGTLQATHGMRLVPGEGIVHFFAVVGDDLLTRAVLASTTKVTKLDHVQVLHLFREHATALKYVAPGHSKQTSVQVFVRSIKTEARTPTDEIVANLHSFKTRATVEHWEPAHVYGRLSHEEIVASGGITNSADVVFGVSDGDNVYVIGYRLGSQRGTKNVSVFRDGGTLQATHGMRLVPGEGIVHFFAVVGDDLLTRAVLASTTNVTKLKHVQVLHLFRKHASALDYVAHGHAKQRAMRTLRRIRSKRNS